MIISVIAINNIFLNVLIPGWWENYSQNMKHIHKHQKSVFIGVIWKAIQVDHPSSFHINKAFLIVEY